MAGRSCWADGLELRWRLGELLRPWLLRLAEEERPWDEVACPRWLEVLRPMWPEERWPCELWTTGRWTLG